MKCLNYFLTACMLVFCLMGCKKDDTDTALHLIEEPQVVYDDVHTFSTSFTAGSDSHVSPNSHFYYFEVTSDSSDISVDIDLIKDESSPNGISLDIELAELYENHDFTDIQEAFNIENGQLIQTNAPKGLYAVKVFGNLPGVEHSYNLTVSGNGLTYNGQRETKKVSFSGNWTPWGTGTYYPLGSYNALELSARDPQFTIKAMPDKYFFEIEVKTDNGADFIYRQEQETSDLVIDFYPIETTASYKYIRPSNTSYNYQEPIILNFVGQKLTPHSAYEVNFYSWTDEPIKIVEHNIIEHKIEDIWLTGGGGDVNNNNNPNYSFNIEINDPIYANLIITSQIADYASTNPTFNFILYKGDDIETRIEVYNLKYYYDYIDYTPLDINKLVGEIYRVPINESGTYSLAFLGDESFTNQDFEFYFITQGIDYSVSQPEKMW